MGCRLVQSGSPVSISSMQASSCLILCGDILLWAQRIGKLSPVSIVCSTASVCPVKAEPGTGNRSANSRSVRAIRLRCGSSRSADVRSNSSGRWSGKLTHSSGDPDGRSITGWIAVTWPIIPISEWSWSDTPPSVNSNPFFYVQRMWQHRS